MRFFGSIYWVICLIVLNPSLLNAEMYKWIDDQGRVHYGDKPKNKTTAIQLKSEQKYQSKPNPSAKSEKPQSNKTHKSTDLTNKLGGHELYEKVKNWTYEDYEQHQAKIMDKDEENRQHILQRMEERQARYEEEAAERQREFDRIQKENEAQQRYYDQFTSPSPETKKFLERLRSKSRQDQNDYSPDIYDGNGNLITRKKLPGEKSSYQKFMEAQERKERRRKKAEKIGKQQQMRIQDQLNRQY